MTQELTPPDAGDALERYIDAISEGQEPKMAAKSLGVSEKVIRASLSTPRAARLLRERRQARIEGDLANLAIRTIRESLTAGPPAVRLKAAQIVLTMAGHGDGESPADKPQDLTEMSPAQLRAFVEMATERLGELAKPVAQGSAD